MYSLPQSYNQTSKCKRCISSNAYISYTADYSNEIWGEVMQFLERNCKFIKDIELSSGLVSIYETDVVNEFLVRFELENGGKNIVFWRTPDVV